MNKSVDMHHPEQRRLASIAAYNRVGLASIARAWVGLASITACNSPGHPDIHT